MKLVLNLILLTTVYCYNNHTWSLILNFTKENVLKTCFFLVCWGDADKFRMHKLLSEEQMDLRVTFLPIVEHIIEEIDDTVYNNIGVVLDLSCKNVTLVLKESSNAEKFRLIYRWMMIGDSSVAEDDIKAIFDTIPLRMDSDIKVALPDDGKSLYDIFDVYDPGREVDIKINKVGSFQNSKFTYFRTISYYESRKDMLGVLLKTANTESFSFANPEHYLNELRTREVKTFEKYHTNLFLCLATIHSFRYVTTIKFPWFGNNTTGADGGISGLLYHKVLDIGSTGAVMRINRVHHYDYLVNSMQFRTKFFFRNPGIHKVGAEILKPLAAKTWYATLASMLVTSVAIKGAYWVDGTYLNSNIRQSFFTSFVIIVSLLAQQGSSIVPHRLGGRIIFLTVLIFSILIYNYYTSSLVSSLLSTTPPQLTTIKELYESPLKVGIELQPYTITYIIQRRDDFYIQQLNSSKIYDSEPNFFPPKEGLEKVKLGGFAYHTEITTAYPIISRTFEQEQICDLAAMDFVSPGFMSIIITKRSQYRELFQISLVIMRQSGIFKREQNVWIASPPECLSNLRVISVGITDLFLVYVVLAAGILLAIVIFLAEIIWFKMDTKK